MGTRRWLSAALVAAIGISTPLGCGTSEPPPEKSPEEIEKGRQEHIERSRLEAEES
jgi:hypothetical protein